MKETFSTKKLDEWDWWQKNELGHIRGGCGTQSRTRHLKRLQVQEETTISTLLNLESLVEDQCFQEERS